MGAAEKNLKDFDLAMGANLLAAHRDASNSETKPREKHAELEQFRLMLGGLVPGASRDKDGGLNVALAVAKTKSFTEFKKYIADQAALNDQITLSLHRGSFDPYQDLLLDKKFEPLLRGLWEQSSSRSQALPGNADPDAPASLQLGRLLDQFTSELIQIDAKRFVSSKFSSKEGLDELRHILGDVKHFSQDTRAELSKAIAKVGKAEKIANDREVGRVTNAISHWNYFNWFVDSGDIQQAERGALAILESAELFFQKQQEGEELDQQGIVGLLKHADLKVKVDLDTFTAHQKKISEKKDSQNPIDQVQKGLAELWLLLANERHWNDAAHIDAYRARALNKLEGFERRATEVKSPEEFHKFILEVQGFLKSPLSYEGLGEQGLSYAQVTKDLIEEGQHLFYGKGFHKLFEEMPGEEKKAFDQFYQAVDQWQHSMDMGERIDPHSHSESDLVAALRKTKHELWHGYKQHKAISRGISQIAHRAFDGGDIKDIQEANKFIDTMITALEAHNAPQPPLTLRGGAGLASATSGANQVPPLRVRGGQGALLPPDLLQDLHQALQENGVLYKAFQAAEMNGREQLLGLVQSCGEMVVIAAITDGIGLLAKVGEAANVARTLNLSEKILVGAAEGFGRGVAMAITENIVSVATGEVRERPETVLAWLKDALATGSASALSAAFTKGFLVEESAKDTLIREGLKRYTIGGMKAFKHYAVDSGIEFAEEVIDQYVRQALDGDYDALSFNEMQELLSITFGGGGAQQALSHARLAGAKVITELPAITAQAKQLWSQVRTAQGRQQLRQDARQAIRQAAANTMVLGNLGGADSGSSSGLSPLILDSLPQYILENATYHSWAQGVAGFAKGLGWAEESIAQLFKGILNVKAQDGKTENLNPEIFDKYVRPYLLKALESFSDFNLSSEALTSLLQALFQHQAWKIDVYLNYGKIVLNSLVNRGIPEPQICFIWKVFLIHTQIGTAELYTEPFWLKMHISNFDSKLPKLLKRLEELKIEDWSSDQAYERLCISVKNDEFALFKIDWSIEKRDHLIQSLLNSGWALHNIHKTLSAYIRSMDCIDWNPDQKYEFIFRLFIKQGKRGSPENYTAIFRALEHSSWTYQKVYQFLFMIEDRAGPMIDFALSEFVPVLKALLDAQWSYQNISNAVLDLFCLADGYAAGGIYEFLYLYMPSQLNVFRAFLGYLNDYNRYPVLNLIKTHRKDLQKLGDKRSTHLALYLEICKRWPRLGFNILENLIEATIKGQLSTDLDLKTQQKIFDFIERVHSFHPILFQKYLEAGEALFAELNSWTNRLLSEQCSLEELRDLATREGDEYLLALLQSFSPTSGASFVPKEEQLALMKQMLEAGDLRHHVPEAWRHRVESFSLQLGGYKLKDGQSVDADGQLKSVLKQLRQQPDAQHQVSPEDLQTRLLAFVQSGRRDPQAREALLQGLFQLSANNTALREKAKSIQNFDPVGLEILEQLLSDKDEVPSQLKNALQGLEDRVLLESVGAQSIQNETQLLKSLKKCWEDNIGGKNLSREARRAILGRILARFDATEIRSKILNKVGPELRETIEAVLDNFPEVLRLQVVEDLFSPLRQQIKAEKAKYTHIEEIEIHVGLRAVKGPGFVLHGLSSGVCTAPDVELWKNPKFKLFAITDEEKQQAVGYMHVFETMIDGKPYLTLPGINPSTEFLGGVDAQKLYDGLVEKVIVFAQAGSYAGVYIPTEQNIHSNRSGIQSAIQKARYPRVNIPEVQWNTQPNPYPFTEVYRVWESNSPPHSKPSTPNTGIGLNLLAVGAGLSTLFHEKSAEAATNSLATLSASPNGVSLGLTMLFATSMGIFFAAHFKNSFLKFPQVKNISEKILKFTSPLAARVMGTLGSLLPFGDNPSSPPPKPPVGQRVLHILPGIEDSQPELAAQIWEDLHHAQANPDTQSGPTQRIQVLEAILEGLAVLHLKLSHQRLGQILKNLYQPLNLETEKSRQILTKLEENLANLPSDKNDIRSQISADLALLKTHPSETPGYQRALTRVGMMVAILTHSESAAAFFTPRQIARLFSPLYPGQQQIFSLHFEAPPALKKFPLNLANPAGKGLVDTEDPEALRIAIQTLRDTAHREEQRLQVDRGFVFTGSMEQVANALCKVNLVLAFRIREDMAILTMRRRNMPGYEQAYERGETIHRYFSDMIDFEIELEQGWLPLIKPLYAKGKPDKDLWDIKKLLGNLPRRRKNKPK